MLKNMNERIDDLNISGLKIIQNKEYFLFGMDSVLLANTVSSNSASNVIIDLCTGSAVIPILLTAKVKSKCIIGVELQTVMYELAIRNVEMNRLENEVHVMNEDIKNEKKILCNIKQLTGKEKADIVICNPPYKKVGTGSLNDKEVRYNARHEILCDLEDIFKTSSKILRSKGKLYMVHKPERLADLITLARKYNLEIKNLTMLQPSLKKKPSILLLEYVRDGGNESSISPVIIEYDEDGKYTEEIKNIYCID